MGNGLKDATTTHVAFAINIENKPNSLGDNHKHSMPQRPNELKSSFHWIYITFSSYLLYLFIYLFPLSFVLGILAHFLLSKIVHIS